jgi:hypothetical protein
MGVEPPKNPDSIPKTTRRGGVWDTNTAQIQFLSTDLAKYGEPAYGRQNFDNPAFLWPKDSYQDITGRELKVQRGYMRSLLTDPKYPGNAGAKNRRLFFQFNPQVLVRSVQQSVGAMNPLLQDPAQLAMPIPGTASFGFDLIFNREHEVNAGYNDPNQEWFELPNGSQALVSQVGVLADLMVLDTITGQGLSKDLIDIVTKRTNADQTRRQQEYLDLKIEAQKSKDYDENEFLRQYKPVEEFGSDQISSIFNSNIGNSAFLNPLPFRIMFSSLFMVEGLATSITVEFQKFSRTMIPTLCKVNINMYALYIGFAKQKTFLYDNLSQAKQESEAQKTRDEVVQQMLDFGLKKITFEKIRITQEINNVNNFAPRVQINVDRTDQLKEQISKKRLKDVKLRVKMNYALFSTSGPVSDSELTNSVLLQLTKDGAEITTDVPLEKVTDSQGLVSIELSENLKATLSKNPSQKYLSFRLEVEVIGKGETNVEVGVVLNGIPAQYGIDVSADNAEGSVISWTNPKKYGQRIGGL